MQGPIADEEAGYRLPEEGRSSSEGGGLLIIGHHGECRECQTRGVGLKGDGEEPRLRDLARRGEERSQRDTLRPLGVRGEGDRLGDGLTVGEDGQDVLLAVGGMATTGDDTYTNGVQTTIALQREAEGRS